MLPVFCLNNWKRLRLYAQDTHRKNTGLIIHIKPRGLHVSSRFTACQADLGWMRRTNLSMSGIVIRHWSSQSNSPRGGKGPDFLSAKAAEILWLQKTKGFLMPGKTTARSTPLLSELFMAVWHHKIWNVKVFVYPRCTCLDREIRIKEREESGH